MEYSGLAGTLKINPNGTYSWNGTQVVSGKWRQATKEEMDKSYKGGVGLVLLNAKAGRDWIVTKRATDSQKGDNVTVADLEYRNTREFGSRG
ncbi:MAG: hypothetical protein HY319_12500 [Armatimonadetes bacterium]|nr:hypothetical protein [Armatimonadota bacterium]